MSNAKTFADMFNVFLYNGKQVISPDSLTEVDPTEIADLMSIDFNGAEIDPLQKHRDIIKRMCVMTDYKKTYVLLGIENQSHVDRTMAVRVMLYDAIRYLQQFKEIAHRNKDNKKQGIDHLSGVGSDDTIYPIVTLVINFDSKQWNEPTNLHGLFETDEAIQDLLAFVPDFQMNLFDPHVHNKEDFNSFQTALKQIFKYIKFSRNKEALREVMQEDPAYTDMDVLSAKLIDAVTGSNLRNLPKEGTVNMCKAIEDMILDGKNDAKEEIAINLLNEGADVDFIAKVTKLSKDVILSLRSRLPAHA